MKVLVSFLSSLVFFISIPDLSSCYELYQNTIDQSGEVSPISKNFCLRSPYASRYGSNCPQQHPFYHQKPATTTVIANYKVKPKPKTEVCNYIKDLFDNGKYLKSACFVYQGLNYDAAKQKCSENFMNLFIMDDTFIETQLYDAAQEKFPGGILWVNGKRQTLSKRWKVFDIDGSPLGPLDSNINFYSNHAIGNCLQIAGQYTGIIQALPANCAEGRYFICEHFKKTQSPPTLDTSKCLYKRDLHVNSQYIKSLCVVNQGLNYDQSRRKCAESGMNLFMIDSAEVDEAFFEAAEDILKAYPGGHFWVNGIRDPQTNQWYVLYSDLIVKGPIYEEFEWVRKDNINGITNGDCLWLSGERGPYQGIGVTCAAGSWFICEYTKDH